MVIKTTKNKIQGNFPKCSNNTVFNIHVPALNSDFFLTLKHKFWPIWQISGFLLFSGDLSTQNVIPGR